MSFALVREYLSLIDEQGGNKGYVQPCEIYRHISSQGIDPQKAAALTGLVSLIGGVATGSTSPMMIRTLGQDRPMIEIPASLDVGEVLKVGTTGLRNQVLAIAEALVIPRISNGLKRKIHTPLHSQPEVDASGMTEKELKKARKKAKKLARSQAKEQPKGQPKERIPSKPPGVAVVVDLLMKNRSLISNILGPIVKNLVSGRR